MKNDELGFKRPNSTPSFIGEYQVSDAICDELIEFFETHPERHADGMYGGNVNKEKKDSIDIALHPSEPIFEQYMHALAPCTSAYVDEYGFAGYYDSWASGVMSLQRYEPGQGFHAWHSERTRAHEPFASRHLVFMTYLNTVTDNGETEFFYQRMKFQPQKGLTLIWPADWTFTHRGILSPTQTKYIATGWMNYLH